MGFDAVHASSGVHKKRGRVWLDRHSCSRLRAWLQLTVACCTGKAALAREQNQAASHRAAVLGNMVASRLPQKGQWCLLS